MRVAPKGKWFIECTDLVKGRKFFPFYDGFDTKKEAHEVCDKLNQATTKFTHRVIGNRK